jgi:hypothetical protein
MSELRQERFETQMMAIARGFEYPRTPDIAATVMTRLRPSTRPKFASRRLAWSLALILVLLSSVLLIPPARAAILEFIQIGIVRIFRAEPTPLAPPQQQSPATMTPVTATPSATSQPLIPILERLAGEASLEEAQQAVDYSILLPSYPADLGLPDRVFVQEAEGEMTILVWIDPADPTEVLMSLHVIPPGSWAVEKMHPALIEETAVDGERAVWAVGPYPVRFSNGNLDFVRLIDGYVLIWTEGELTYRLETDLDLEEAIRVAESLETAP